jgi:Cid1 family poly A polymerase
MILNFLQTRDPPILPALHQKPHQTYIANDGTESGFSDDLNAHKDHGQQNKESIAELLFQFFRRYAFEIEYGASVVSVRHGRLLSRKEKKWDHASKEGQWQLCIEEPFNVTRNLGNSADDTAFRGIHLELRRAFDLLADGGQLEKCCEQYQFPPEEKIGLFKKPTGGVKAILTAPGTGRHSRQNAGGNNRASGRTNPSGKNTSAAYRRSSSGAAYGRMTGTAGQLPYMQGQMMPPTPELVSRAPCC